MILYPSKEIKMVANYFGGPLGSRDFGRLNTFPLRYGKIDSISDQI